MMKSHLLQQVDVHVRLTSLFFPRDKGSRQRLQNQNHRKQVFCVFHYKPIHALPFDDHITL